MDLISYLDEAIGANNGVQLLHLVLRLGADSGHVSVQCAPNAEYAKAAFRTGGNQFWPPVFVATVHDASGAPPKMTSGETSVPMSAPLESHDRIVGIGEEGFLWRGYGNNQRGVVRVRSGRYQIEVNAPTVAEAKRLARVAVALVESR